MAGDPLEDTPQYLDKWARRLARALPRGDLRALLEHYHGLANDRSLAKADRQAARRRARYLRKRVVTIP